MVSSLDSLADSSSKNQTAQIADCEANKLPSSPGSRGRSRISGHVASPSIGRKRNGRESCIFEQKVETGLDSMLSSAEALTALADGFAQLTAKDSTGRSITRDDASHLVQQLTAQLAAANRQLEVRELEVAELKEQATQDHLMKPSVARKLNDKIRALESDIQGLRNLSPGVGADMDKRAPTAGVVYTLKMALLDMEKRFHGCIYAFPDLEELWSHLLEAVDSSEANSDLVRLHAKRYEKTVASLVVGIDGSYIGAANCSATASTLVHTDKAEVGKVGRHMSPSDVQRVESSLRMEHPVDDPMVDMLKAFVACSTKLCGTAVEEEDTPETKKLVDTLQACVNNLVHMYAGIGSVLNRLHAGPGGPAGKRPRSQLCCSVDVSFLQTQTRSVRQSTSALKEAFCSAEGTAIGVQPPSSVPALADEVITLMEQLCILAAQPPPPQIPHGVRLVMPDNDGTIPLTPGSPVSAMGALMGMPGHEDPLSPTVSPCQGTFKRASSAVPPGMVKQLCKLFMDFTGTLSHGDGDAGDKWPRRLLVATPSAGSGQETPDAHAAGIQDAEAAEKLCLLFEQFLQSTDIAVQLLQYPMSSALPGSPPMVRKSHTLGAVSSSPAGAAWRTDDSGMLTSTTTMFAGDVTSPENSIKACTQGIATRLQDMRGKYAMLLAAVPEARELLADMADIAAQTGVNALGLSNDYPLLSSRIDALCDDKNSDDLVLPSMERTDQDQQQCPDKDVALLREELQRSAKAVALLRGGLHCAVTCAAVTREEMQSRLDAASDAMQGADQEAALLRSQLQGTNKDVALLREELQCTITCAAVTKEEMQSRLDAASEAMQGADQEAALLRSQLQSAHTDVELLQGQLASADRDIGWLQEEVSELKGLVDAQGKQLTTAAALRVQLKNVFNQAAAHDLSTSIDCLSPAPSGLQRWTADDDGSVAAEEGCEGQAAVQHYDVIGSICISPDTNAEGAAITMEAAAGLESESRSARHPSKQETAHSSETSPAYTARRSLYVDLPSEPHPGPETVPSISLHSKDNYVATSQVAPPPYVVSSTMSSGFVTTRPLSVSLPSFGLGKPKIGGSSGGGAPVAVVPSVSQSVTRSPITKSHRVDLVGRSLRR